ncbi:MAG: ribonuclease P protein component [Flavobacteriia bacterium]|nr:ribonuclease P protein component [Flavobacteriia bacterium]
MNARFPKSEKLTHRNLFTELIKEGSAVNAFPIKLIFKEVDLPEDVPYQIGFAVSKRKFKLAVDRNRMKRVLRESWRQGKSEFITSANGKKYAFLMIYLSNDKVNKVDIDKALAKAHKKWSEKLG